jgi:three-Cys-motif partner protein
MSDGSEVRRFSSDTTENFFEAREPQNKLKTDIIVGFFKAYAPIILSKAAEIDYIDLYAGRGYYDRCAVDPSLKGPVDATALAILRAIIAEPRWAASVRTWFNDGDRDYVRQLRSAISALPSVGCLRFRPRITEAAVSDDLAAVFQQRKNVPTFFFFDPYGYIGLTRELLRAALTKSWGCDIAFFFNYRRINMNLGKGVQDPHLDMLFGIQRLAHLRAEVSGVEEAVKRETIILARLKEAMREIGATFFLSYRFRAPDGQTSHHLAYVTTHAKGHDTMKDRMARESAKSPDGVPYFEFVPDAPASEQIGLFDRQVIIPPRDFPYSVRALANELHQRYLARTVRLSMMFRAHNVGKPYIMPNYRDAVWNLRDRHLVTLRREGGDEPRRGQCPDDTDITFVAMPE